MDNWTFLKNKFETGNLAHAYVLAGADHEAKKKFAQEFIAFIGCKFPDVLTIKSGESESSVKNEKDMMEIDVDQIRQVQNFLSYKSYNGGYKMVVVEHAERMNSEAQNCLLKNLEEPRGNTLIFLLAGTAEMLLPTISSRCQVVQFAGELAKHAMPQALLNVLGADLAEKFLYAKNANLEGEEFENILHALQNHWRKDVAKHQKVLKLAMDLERQAQISNINKKLALEVLLLEISL